MHSNSLGNSFRLIIKSFQFAFVKNEHFLFFAGYYCYQHSNDIGMAHLKSNYVSNEVFLLKNLVYIHEYMF